MQLFTGALYYAPVYLVGIDSSFLIASSACCLFFINAVKLIKVFK